MRLTRIAFLHLFFFSFRFLSRTRISLLIVTARTQCKWPPTDGEGAERANRALSLRRSRRLSIEKRSSVCCYPQTLSTLRPWSRKPGYAMVFLRSVWSEFNGFYENSQFRSRGRLPKCADFELNAFECMEAYGYYRGERYCKTYLDDFEECLTSLKQVRLTFAVMKISNPAFLSRQMRRVELMQIERYKQVKNGERGLSDFWGPNPPRDSYIYGPFQK